MRHQRLRRKLGVTTDHRKALLRNLVKSLVIHKQIQTTFGKAKEASAMADRMVQLAKDGSLHARRTLISRLGCSKTAHALITTVAPQFKTRQGGYTRVLRLGTRKGDQADMALLEFTAVFAVPEKTKKAKKTKVAEVKEVAPETKKSKAKEKDTETRKEEKKTPSTTPEKGEKKESEKKGGFLGGLRRFFKGEDDKS